MSNWRKGNIIRHDLAAMPPTIWILALVVLLLASVACGLWAFYVLRLQQPLPGVSPTPIIWTATPAPTLPPTIVPTETPQPTPTVSPEIAIGRYVRVTGTEGVGVSMREQPDINSARRDIGQEGEVFVALDGPRQVGGYTWWLIRDREDEARQGWVVANYLEPVDRP
jgi:hypothetical protein